MCSIRPLLTKLITGCCLIGVLCLVPVRTAAIPALSDETACEPDSGQYCRQTAVGLSAESAQGEIAAFWILVGASALYVSACFVLNRRKTTEQLSL